MINSSLHQKRFSILITFIVAFCLLFAGMRVPDLARTHRPKPSQRAVIESNDKVSLYIVNKSTEIFAIMAKSTELQTTLAYRTEFDLSFQLAEFQFLFPNSSRAPPLFLS
jgi:hypothetical protein